MFYVIIWVLLALVVVLSVFKGTGTICNRISVPNKEKIELEEAKSSGNERKWRGKAELPSVDDVGLENYTEIEQKCTQKNVERQNRDLEEGIYSEIGFEDEPSLMQGHNKADTKQKSIVPETRIQSEGIYSEIQLECNTEGSGSS